MLKNMAKTQLSNHSTELEIPQNNPFKNCVLDREIYAKILTDVVSRYSASGCVMALNGEWGTGKTTFVKMWKTYMENNGLKTLYFDAWTNDFVDDPLIAMISELKSLQVSSDTFDEVARTAGRLLWAAATTSFQFLVEKHTGINKDTIKAATDELNNIGQDAIKELEEQKKTLTDFKEKLSCYIADNSKSEKPVVFIIDELDRCNPRFAVKLLERIKHLFDIPNIVFVLSINKSQLECSIRGFYGTDSFDAHDYLERFIDIEYQIPKPDYLGMSRFIENLYKKYGFDDFFIYREADPDLKISPDKKDFVYFAISLFNNKNHGLRMIDRLFSFIRLIVLGFDNVTYFNPIIVFFLCYFKLTDSDFYERIKNHQLSIQELLEELEKRLLAIDNTQSFDNSVHVEHLAAFIMAYNRTDKGNSYHDKEFEDELINTGCRLSCKVVELSKLNLYLRLYHDDKGSLRGLDYIIQRIEILSPMITYM